MLKEQDFKAPAYAIPSDFEGKVQWKSPSNIALIKYWGKHGIQLPSNPSISFTLDHCHTDTTLAFKNDGKGEVKFFFEGKEAPAFAEKSMKFLDKIQNYVPFLESLSLEIHTQNSFPHSSGIASSASGMSALALGILSIEKELNPELSDDVFAKKASFLARIGSGSASRSTEGGLVVWGQHEAIKESSDLYAIRYNEEVASVFETYQDVVLLVDRGQKKVSSTVGHSLMHSNPFSEQRFEFARKNMSVLKGILKEGNLDEFNALVEREALMLHALMMSSEPYFILFKPNTLSIIEKIWEFREATQLPVSFTLDAGANVHVLFPKTIEQKAMEFVKNELIGYCQQEMYICDCVGSGPKRMV